jgi:branched-chain amino acid transport system permease protein
MVNVAEILVAGLLTSSFYALLAIGLTLVYSIAGIENLAHGSYVMVGAYGAFITTELLGLAPPLQIVVSVAVGILAAVLTGKGIGEHILENHVSVFIVTVLLALVIQQVFIILFSPEPRLFDPVVEGTVSILDTTVSWNLVLAFATSWACLLGLGVLVKRTQIGRNIMAVAQNRKAAELAGVDIDRVYLLVWVLSGAFAGLVGVFYGQYTSLQPHMWVFPLIYSFSIVIVGGLGSLKGTIVAAHVIGFIEMATVQIDPRFKGVPALFALILIMLLKPEGLFGREELE